MKLELKENMYVRFKDKRGIEYIRKIVNIPEDNRYASLYLDKEANYSYGLSPKNVIKASFNIIDLIEVGDLVEIEFYSPRYEKRITRLFEVDFKNNSYITFNNAHCQLNIVDGIWSDADLKPVFKSIVTKEQFENVEYRIGDE